MPDIEEQGKNSTER